MRRGRKGRAKNKGLKFQERGRQRTPCGVQVGGEVEKPVVGHSPRGTARTQKREPVTASVIVAVNFDCLAGHGVQSAVYGVAVSVVATERVTDIFEEIEGII